MQAGLQTQNLYAFISSGTGLARVSSPRSFVWTDVWSLGSKFGLHHVVRLLDILQNHMLLETFNHGSWSWFASCFQVSFLTQTPLQLGLSGAGNQLVVPGSTIPIPIAGWASDTESLRLYFIWHGPGAESHSKSLVRLSETFNHGSWSWFASCFQVSYDPNSFAIGTIRSEHCKQRRFTLQAAVR